MDQKEREKKQYIAPKLIELGPVQKLTGWVGGNYGEFLGGQGTGYNIWKDPAGS